MVWLIIVNCYLRWPAWATGASGLSQLKAYSWGIADHLRCFHCTKLAVVKTSCWLAAIAIADVLSNRTLTEAIDHYSATLCEVD